MIYKRNCPKCNSEIEYKNARSFKWAERDGKQCRSCYSKKISSTLKGKKYGKLRRKDSEIEKIYFRDCPECKKPIGYSTMSTLKEGNRKKTICNSCTAYKYNKSWNNIITEDSINKMRASKAGFKSFEEYLEKYPDKEMYKRNVWRLTYQNDLTILENWDKRGRCGVDGAYQLDHIYPISKGYDNNIPPEEIAKMENLRMVPWRENLKKSNRL
jgi:endogenous inhibitor of DNA gyrase (YacG/DUF329 family)